MTSPWRGALASGLLVFLLSVDGGLALEKLSLAHSPIKDAVSLPAVNKSSQGINKAETWHLLGKIKPEKQEGDNPEESKQLHTTAYSSDGSVVVTGNSDCHANTHSVTGNLARGWQQASLLKAASPTGDEFCKSFAVDVSRDSTKTFVGGWAHMSFVFDSRTKEVLAHLVTADGPKFHTPVTQALMAPDGLKVLVVGVRWDAKIFEPSQSDSQQWHSKSKLDNGEWGANEDPPFDNKWPLAWSPDSKQILSGGGDGGLDHHAYIWAAPESGDWSIAHKLKKGGDGDPDEQGHVRSVAWRADGRVAVLGDSKGDILFYKAKENKAEPLSQWAFWYRAEKVGGSDSDNAVIALAVSWNYVNHRLAHDEEVTAMWGNQKGKVGVIRTFSVKEEGKNEIRHVDKESLESDKDENQIDNIAFAASGREAMVTMGNMEIHIYRHDVDMNKVQGKKIPYFDAIDSFDLADTGHSLSWDPTGHYVLAGFKSQCMASIIAVGDGATAKVGDDLNGRPPSGEEDLCTSTAAVWSPDGSRIFLASLSHRAAVWKDARAGDLTPEDRWEREEAFIDSENNVKIVAAAWAPDGSRIVTVSDKFQAYIWEPSKIAENPYQMHVVQRQELGDVSGSPLGAGAIAFDPKGKSILLATGVQKVMILEEAKPPPVKEREENPDDKVLLEKDAEMEEDVGAGSPRFVKQEKETNFPVRAVAWCDSGKIFAAVGGSSTAVWRNKGTTTKPDWTMSKIEADDGVCKSDSCDGKTTVAFTEDCKSLAVGTSKGVLIHQSDGKEDLKKNDFIPIDEQTPVYSVSWAPNGRELLVGFGAKVRLIRVCSALMGCPFMGGDGDDHGDTASKGGWTFPLPGFVAVLVIVTMLIGFFLYKKMTGGGGSDEAASFNERSDEGVELRNVGSQSRDNVGL